MAYRILECVTGVTVTVELNKRSSCKKDYSYCIKKLITVVNNYKKKLITRNYLLVINY